YQSDGREYLVSPLHPNFWRVPIDNDNGWKAPEKMRAWQNAGTTAELQSLNAENTSEGARIVADLKLPATKSTVQMTYLLRGDGALNVKLQLTFGDGAPELPRIGVQFVTRGDLKEIRWFGRGPQENYWDRKTGA